MMMQRIMHLAQGGLFYFEDFSDVLVEDVTERRFLELSWQGRVPKGKRVGHQKPRWPGPDVASWIIDELTKPRKRARGRPRLKLVRDDLA